MIIDYKEIKKIDIASQELIGILKSIEGVESVVANTVNLRDMTINYYIRTKGIGSEGVIKMKQEIGVIDKVRVGAEYRWVAKKSYA